MKGGDTQWYSAYLLHRRPWKETSWLADFLLRDRGRIRLIVRGARGTGKRGHAWMQPFVPLKIQWRGRSSLPSLTQAEQEGLPLALEGRNLLAGFYLNELLFKLLPEGEACDSLFSLYHWLIQALTGADETQLFVLLRRFELALLEVLGYGLNLQALPEEGWWVYDLHSGWKACSPGHAGAIHARQLQHLQTAESLQPEQARALRPLLRTLLTQLHPTAGEESRALLRAWMQLEKNQTHPQ